MSQQQAPMRIMLTGGGTGGHVFPLIAVVEQLRALNPECSFHWFGSRRMEAELVPQLGIDGTFIPFTFSYRKLGLRSLSYYLRTLPTWLLGIPVWSALGALLRFKPHLVLSSGGYVSVPMLLAAKLNGTPIAIVEINGVPGRVTQRWARSAKRIYCATEQIARRLASLAGTKAIVSGFPSPLPKLNLSEARAHFGLPESLPILVVQGGSTGATAVNRVLESLLADNAFAAKYREKLAILHQRGGNEAAKMDEARWLYYRAISFDKDLYSLYFAASLYFGRAGAATIGELVAAKLPALLMPYPLHADKQQYRNAEALTDIGAAEVVEEGDAAAPTKLMAMIESGIFGATGGEMRQAYSVLQGNGAKRIAEDVLTSFAPVRKG